MYPISQRNERFVMNIEFDAYKQKLNDCRPALDPFIESYLNCLATGSWVQK